MEENVKLVEFKYPVVTVKRAEEISKLALGEIHPKARSISRACRRKTLRSYKSAGTRLIYTAALVEWLSTYTGKTGPRSKK